MRPSPRPALLVLGVLLAAVRLEAQEHVASSPAPFDAARVRIHPAGASHPVAGWVRRSAGDTLWLASCRASHCPARPYALLRETMVEVSVDYDRVASARHWTVVGGAVLGMALGYAWAGGPGTEGYGHLAGIGGGLLGFAVGAIVAEPWHPERWVPSRRP